MPRRPRIHLDGMPLYIVQRGHNREPCFFGEEDYQTYLYWLGKALKQEHCALHAYALMTNNQRGQARINFCNTTKVPMVVAFTS